MLKVLFAAKPEAWAEYQAPLNKAFSDAGQGGLEPVGGRREHRG